MNAISKSREWPPDGQAPTGPTPVALRAPSVVPVEKHNSSKNNTTGLELNYTEKLSEPGGQPRTEMMSATSWHHTGSYFKETDHYNLNAVAEKLIEVKETLGHDYNTYKILQKKEVANIKYGVINVQEWGGTRNRPKLEGYDKVAGIIIGNWLFYKSNHSTDGIIKKYKTISNKVEWLKEYESYKELVKNHKEYKSTKRVFSKIIAEKA